MNSRTTVTTPAVRSVAAPAVPGRADAAAPFASARFYVCVGVLAAAALSMQGAAKMLGQHFRKEAIALRKSFSQFDVARLSPNYTTHATPPAPIDPETLQTLGTDEYVVLRLVDTSKPREDATSVAHVFVTYYTGKPDQVPHVPDECMSAGGYALQQAGWADVPVADVGAPDNQIPMRVLTFHPRQGLRNPFAAAARVGPTVAYFFHTNGRYVTTRDQVRLIQSNLFERYSYYAKIEVNFTDYAMVRSPSREESLAALRPLLERVVPILVHEHLPDWEKAGAAPAGTS